MSHIRWIDPAKGEHAPYVAPTSRLAVALACAAGLCPLAALVTLLCLASHIGSEVSASLMLGGP